MTPTWALLRRWRRKMTLRIAYRDVNGLASTPTTVEELTRLGEFCLRECYGIALRQWTRRYGEPWDEELGRPARFCVLGPRQARRPGTQLLLRHRSHLFL